MGKKDEIMEKVLDGFWALAKGLALGLVISGAFLFCIKETRNFMSVNDRVMETVELLRHRVEVLERNVNALDRRLDADERLLDAKIGLR